MKYPALLLAMLLCVAPFSVAEEEAAPLFTNYEYWPDGVVRERTVTDAAGNILRKTYYWEDGLVQEDEKFDSEGNEIEESHYDEQGHLTNGVDGWAAMKCTYQDGNLMTQTYYGEFGYVQERKIYNSDGDLIDKQYYGDNNMDPYEEYNPVPIMGTEEEQFFSQDGAPEGTTSVTID